MIRRLFFWFLVIGFFIITPLLIFYALGYRYSFDRGIFIFSGSITLKSNPERILIDINGKPAPTSKVNYLNKSYHIDGLRPGEYSIRVHQDGFQDWNKNVTVQSGISTEFWNIILPRSEYPTVQYDKTAMITRFFPAPRDTLLAIAESDPSKPMSLKIVIADTKNNASQEIYTSEETSLTSDPLQNIEWSPREDMLLVPIEIPTQGEKQTGTTVPSEPSYNEDHIILSIGQNTTPQLLSTLLPKGWIPMVTRWSPNERKTLYFINNGSLWKINLSDTTVQPTLVAENILGYDFYTDHIIVLRSENHIFYRYTLDTGSSPVQITTTALSENDNDPHRLIVYDDRKIALINSQKDLFIHNVFDNNTYTKKIASLIEGAQFSDDGKKLLFWNKHEVFVYFTEKWETQPQRSEDTILQIARFFDPISNVQWSKDYEHILFSQGTEIKVLALDMRGGQEGFILKTVTTKDPLVFMSARDDKIYYTDQKDGQTTLFSIDFPEPTGFFGG